jgi:hypothetical protein
MTAATMGAISCLVGSPDAPALDTAHVGSIHTIVEGKPLSAADADPAQASHTKAIAMIDALL